LQPKLEFVRFIPAIIGLMVIIGIDLLLWFSLKQITADYSTITKKILHYSFLFVSLLGFIVAILAFLFRMGQFGVGSGKDLVAMLFILIACKLVVAFFLLFTDFIRISQYGISLIINLLSSSDNEITLSGITRIKFIQQIGWITGGVLFGTFIMGMVKWAYDYRVEHIKLAIPGLPAGFEGAKIVQISDLHIGSFRNSNPVEKIASIVNGLEKDVIFFTGDLVNIFSVETEPHIDALKRIKAPMGVYSILGNHDYGTYYNWQGDTEAEKKNLQNLEDIEKDLGWDLLKNENRILERNGDKIALIGVENWGKSRFMPKFGKLKEAYQGVEDIPVKLLLSHDPSHWDAEVNQEFKNIAVTFSGHTHGSQFGVNIPGFKWSPAKYFFKQWAGLYKKGTQQLYVNKGVGFIGYPGRVGMLPEITLFELTAA